MHTTEAPAEPAAPEMKRAMITVETFLALNESAKFKK